MLATFLKTQRPSWPPLHGVLEELELEKQKINIWKEDFDKNVIKRALADHESRSSVATSVILGNPNREIIEVEDSQNSQDSQENNPSHYASPAKRQKLGHPQQNGDDVDISKPTDSQEN